jgi:hypothetical protein
MRSFIMAKADNESAMRVSNPFSKEQRARDAVLATRDYEAAKKAELDKTARLRELRLARDAALAAAPQAPAKPLKKVKKAAASRP